MQKNELISYGQLAKCYKEKKYKRGLKIVNKLLSNKGSPIFSKLLAWKGLFCGYLFDPRSALKIVRKGLKADGESALNWHIHGKLCAMKAEFKIAIESYKHALNLEPANINIMEDLALVSVHLNDFENFTHWTGKIVNTFLNNRNTLASRSMNYWIWYAVGLHLLGDLQGALTIIGSCCDFQKSHRKRFNEHQKSELLLFQNQLIRESGEKTKALEHMLKNREQILDSVSADEILFDLFFENNQFQDALTVCQSLINRNPNNKLYYRNFFKAMKLKSKSSKVVVLEKFIRDQPDASIPKALLLQYSTGRTFLRYLEEHLSVQLRRGSPNLYESIKGILVDKKKKDFIMSYLKKHAELVASIDSHCQSRRIQAENELIANYICASKILCSEQKYSEALQKIQNSLLLDPLNADCYLVKAKILKHALNPTEACKAVEKAQRMDPADRYLKIKLVKYILKVGIIDRAEKMYADLFQNDQTEDRDGLPKMWILFEKALALERSGNYEESLMYCAMVENSIVAMENRMFELHSLCLKRLTLRSYEESISSMRKLRSNKYYKKTAILAVNLALKLHDIQVNQQKTQKLKPWERGSRSIRKSPSSMSSISSLMPGKTRSKMDLGAVDITQIGNPIIFVEKFIKSLQQYHANSVETHVLSFEVNRRLQKPVGMVQSLIEGRNVRSDHASLLLPMIRFQKLLNQWETKKSLPKKQLEFLADLGTEGWKDRNGEELIRRFLLTEEKDLLRLLEAGKALYCLDRSKKDAALRWSRKIRSLREFKLLV